MVDKKYCMSSYLMFRTVLDNDRTFSENLKLNKFNGYDFEREPITNSIELETSLKRSVEQATVDGKCALALSGGIDSAILAKFMPKGSVAYTFKCVVPGIEVTDETETAAKIARECGLEHRIIEIYWEDFEKFAPGLMKKKGAPIHSIEVQIYKAALKILEDGFERVIFGESADCLYGGLSNVLSRDWTVGEFIERFSFLMPYKVLKDYQVITKPFAEYEKNGFAMVHEFYGNVFYYESVASYCNACECAGIDTVLPYAVTKMAVPLDYKRVRNGENKYLVREVFKRLYPNFTIPPKTPMPRPTNEWLRNWEGPKRNEFWRNCHVNMTGDQKWMIYCLEWFLNLLDNGKLD